MSDFGIRELAGVIVFAIFLVPFIFYLLTLQKALAACSPEARTMSPRLVWLLLIPFWNLVWNFFVVIALSKSLHNEFVKRNIVESPAPAKGLGLTMCILFALGVIPYVRSAAGLAFLVCWIIYWVKIAGYSAKLRTGANATIAQSPGATGL